MAQVASGALTERFTDALAYAHTVHADQVRKGSGIPYVSHLLAVCGLVLEEGGDEDQAIAALLHDAVEDQGGRGRLEDIRARFGERVASLVLALSDTVEKHYELRTWHQRKLDYLGSLETESEDVLLVSCADKLHNCRCLLRDLTEVGEALWWRFSGRRTGTLWYYATLVRAYRDRGFDRPIVDELERVVDDLLEAAGSTREEALSFRPPPVL